MKSRRYIGPIDPHRRGSKTEIAMRNRAKGTAILTGATADTRQPSNLRQFLRRLKSRRVSMAALNDHMLNDIGLRRANVFLAQQPFHFDATGRPYPVPSQRRLSRGRRAA